MFKYGNRGEILLASVTDGTSNTLYLSETCSTAIPTASDRVIVSGIADYMSIHGQAASTCLAARGTAGEIRGDLNPWGEGKGHRWGDSRNPVALFHAAMPPNSPSCKDPSGCVAISASSRHPGGVNVGLCDGAVRFVSETIDSGDLTKRLGESLGWTGEGHQWTGPSTAGVWGAVATPHHKESKSL
jgi:prepilin-type processing-associated H-X9-DG protein